MQSDKDKITRLLKTAKGQLEGLIRMVEDDRYCIDISNQLMATQAILKKVNSEILHDHINHCVHGAFGTEEQNEKISEIMLIMDKLTK
ncbi:metal-sensing transcriptional repressor [Proteiniclasticum sp.]|uniref:metal-sensing transcriptional repressor n=1 Tax=Proteiniclasticum sp. TaxID=2053595 RepID=UPI0028994F81|nr:metal-sensing transcriptional repressor [Proteiniclasticum sp.]